MVVNHQMVLLGVNTYGMFVHWKVYNNYTINVTCFKIKILINLILHHLQSTLQVDAIHYITT